MKERKRYQNPDIQVICIRENSDVIQTSTAPLITELTNISGNTSAQRVVNDKNNISGLFN